MKITPEEVTYVADLARLNLTADEVGRLSAEMEQIIVFADKLSELDTAGIMPTNHAMKVENVLREDVVCPSFDRDALLQNAPDQKDGCYAVPKVIE